MDNNTMEHITPEELADYSAARVPEAREEAIEAHLAVCDACTEEARQCYAFAAIWEEWTGVTAGDMVAHPM
jgi:anti-sigma factor RsiW